MSGALPIEIEYIHAVALPVIALSAAAIAFAQYRLAKRKRSDDLFQLRYQLLLDICTLLPMAEKNERERFTEQPDFNDFISRSRILFDKEFALEVSGLLVDFMRNDFHKEASRITGEELVKTQDAGELRDQVHKMFRNRMEA